MLQDQEMLRKSKGLRQPVCVQGLSLPILWPNGHKARVLKRFQGRTARPLRETELQPGSKAVAEAMRGGGGERPRLSGRCPLSFRGSRPGSHRRPRFQNAALTVAVCPQGAPPLPPPSLMKTEEGRGERGRCLQVPTGRSHGRPVLSASF